MRFLLKICLALTALMSILPAVADQPFYVYRNDGVINPFFISQVDSIACSRIDVDSIEHDDYVVHEVYTPDSVYRTPLELIDSIGFSTPETVYRPGVVVLEGDVRKYIVECDSLTLVFQSVTPSGLLPKIGDKLVSTIGDEYLQTGFIGKAASVNLCADGYRVECEALDFTDVFECYYGIMRPMPESSNTPSRNKELTVPKYAPGKLDFGTLGLTLPFNNEAPSSSFFYGENPNYALSTNSVVKFSLRPVIDYNASLIVKSGYGVNFSLYVITNLAYSHSFDLGGSLTIGKEWKLLDRGISIPPAFLDLDVEFGLFLKGTASINCNRSSSWKHRHVFYLNWNKTTTDYRKFGNKHAVLENIQSGELGIDGSISGGVFVGIGIAPMYSSKYDLLEIGYQLNAGLTLEGNFVAKKEQLNNAKTDNQFYKDYKSKGLTLCFEYNSSFVYKYLGTSLSAPIPINGKKLLWKRGPFPIFTTDVDEYLNSLTKGKAHVIYRTEGNVSTTNLGFAYKSGSDGFNYDYRVFDYSGPSCEYDGYFTIGSSIYPLFKYMGMDVIGTPAWKTSSSQ